MLNFLRYSCLAIVIVFFSLTQAVALEIYTLVSKGCHAETGLIINEDVTNVYLLNADGEFVSMPRRDIESILVYNTLENPLDTINLNGRLSNYLKEIYLSDYNTPDFLGWPIRFVENLIVFYDIRGKTHIVNMGKILKIREPQKKMPDVLSIKEYQKVFFRYEHLLPNCSQLPGLEENEIQANRMISDKINISKFLAVYQNGFQQLNRFERRTHFYARPFLFPNAIKIGLFYTNDDYREELPAMIPFYFHLSQGTSYGPQTLLVIGQSPVEWLPNLESMLAVKTDLKAYFFNASFAGNLIALSAGKSYIVKNRFVFVDYFAKLQDDDILVFPQFNYLALTGIDWDRFSVSTGMYYPIFGIYADGKFREVLTNTSSPIYRLMYTTMDLNIRLIYSTTELQVAEPSKNNIELATVGDMKTANLMSVESITLMDHMDAYSLNSSFLRLSFDYDLNKEVKIGLEEVIYKGKFWESFDKNSYELIFEHHNTALNIQHQFGDYVVLKLYLYHYLKSYQSNREVSSDQRTVTNITLGVAIEFIL